MSTRHREVWGDKSPNDVDPHRPKGLQSRVGDILLGIRVTRTFLSTVQSQKKDDT